MTSSRFTDKTVIVTGAAGGIGEAYARALAGEGANVVVADLNDEAGEKVAADIGGRYVHTDVSDPDSAAARGCASKSASTGAETVSSGRAAAGAERSLSRSRRWRRRSSWRSYSRSARASSSSSACRSATGIW